AKGNSISPRHALARAASAQIPAASRSPRGALRVPRSARRAHRDRLRELPLRARAQAAATDSQNALYARPRFASRRKNRAARPRAFAALLRIAPGPARKGASWPRGPGPGASPLPMEGRCSPSRKSCWRTPARVARALVGAVLLDDSVLRGHSRATQREGVGRVLPARGDRRRHCVELQLQLSHQFDEGRACLLREIQLEPRERDLSPQPGTLRV